MLFPFCFIGVATAQDIIITHLDEWAYTVVGVPANHLVPLNESIFNYLP